MLGSFPFTIGFAFRERTKHHRNFGAFEPHVVRVPCQLRFVWFDGIYHSKLRLRIRLERFFEIDSIREVGVKFQYPEGGSVDRNLEFIVVHSFRKPEFFKVDQIRCHQVNCAGFYDEGSQGNQEGDLFAIEVSGLENHLFQQRWKRREIRGTSPEPGI